MNASKKIRINLQINVLKKSRAFKNSSDVAILQSDEYTFSRSSTFIRYEKTDFKM